MKSCKGKTYTELDEEYRQRNEVMALEQVNVVAKAYWQEEQEGYI